MPLFTRQRWMGSLLILLLAGLLTAGCAQNETDTNPMVDTSMVAADTMGMAGAQMANVVTVTLSDYRVDMPQTLTSGMTTFEVTNSGQVEHGFEVEGQGMEETIEMSLQPGQTYTLQVDLQPGSYRVYCPLEDHADRGMSMELTVTAADGAVMPDTTAATM